MTPPLPAAEPFPTLAKLRAEHVALQTALDGEEKVKAGGRRVAEFVARAVACGTYLDARDDRKEAQAVINYWLSVASAAELPLATSAAAARLAPERPDLLASAVAAANKQQTEWGDPSAATRKAEWGDLRPLARRVLLRMIRLTADGKVVLTPVRRESLDDLEPRQAVDHLLADFDTAGVVRRSTRPDGPEEFNLRSPKLLTDWPFLRDAQRERETFRAQADVWARAGEPSGRGPRVLTATRRALVSVGKRVDAVWGWVVRRFGGERHMVPDPASEFPDVDFYRDRTQAEVRYLFARRAQAVEGQEWFRVVKGLVLLGLVAAVVAGAVLVLLKVREDGQREKARLDQESEQQEELRQAKDSARTFELEKRRNRQRLKEHVALVRLLAQYKQYDNPQQYPRSQAALWRIEAPVYADAEELQKLRDEWDKIRVDWRSVPDPLNPAAARKDAICADCSASPLTVARELKALIATRTTPGQEGYDEDTLKYRLALQREWYETAQKLATRACDILDAKKTGTEAEPHNYNALLHYLDEFWVLYSGEMAIVEGTGEGSVEQAMVEFGKQLIAMEKQFGELMVARLREVDVKGAERLKEKLYAKPEKPDLKWSVANSALAKSATVNSSNPSGWDTARNSFSQQSVITIRERYAPGADSAFSKAVVELNRLREELERALLKELTGEVKQAEEKLAPAQKR